MSYYGENAQWASAGQAAWDNHASPARSGRPIRPSAEPRDLSIDAAPPFPGTTGPTSQDDFAFYYQFEDIDRAYENLTKSGKTYSMGGRRELPSPVSLSGPAHQSRPSSGRAGRMAPGPGPRAHAMNDFDSRSGHPQSNLQNFYASQRHQSSRGSNEAEQMMQAKRRMAAQRERELRNLHTEQQFQRTTIGEVPYNKSMSEEETRELIARQRSALYGEGQFADKGGYVDETGTTRTGVPGSVGPAGLRGHSPLTYDLGRGNVPPSVDSHTPVSATEGSQVAVEQGNRANSSASPPTNASANKTAFEGAVAQAASRTTNSSPGGSPPRHDLPAGSKPAQSGATVAPIGTRPSGTTPANATAKRSTTPLASPGGWGRGNGVWGQSSGLGAPASVWG